MLKLIKNNLIIFAIIFIAIISLFILYSYMYSSYSPPDIIIHISCYILILAPIAIIYLIVEKESRKRLKQEEIERKLERELEWELKRKEKLRIEREKKEIYEKKKEKIKNSELYKYVINFVKKYKNIGYSPNYIKKLRELLGKKGMFFEFEELSMLIDEERFEQEYRDFELKILYNSPVTTIDCIKNYLEIMGENYNDRIYVYYLRFLLVNNGADIDTDNRMLEIIENVKKDLELSEFEEKLNSADDYNISVDQLDSISGYEFESFLKKLFENLGYEVEQTKLSNDQGADLIINKFGEKIVVQAKRYSRKVNNKAIQEIVAAINYYKADKGIVITTNEFTKSAVQLAESNNIELIDRVKLIKMIKKSFYG